MQRIRQHYTDVGLKNKLYDEFENSAIMTNRGEIAELCEIRKYEQKPEVLGVTEVFFQKHSLNVKTNMAKGILKTSFTRPLTAKLHRNADQMENSLRQPVFRL